VQHKGLVEPVVDLRPHNLPYPSPRDPVQVQKEPLEPHKLVELKVRRRPVDDQQVEGVPYRCIEEGPAA